MDTAELARAVAAAASVTRSLGLDVADSAVLSASNKAVVRLLPCDAVARVAPAALDSAALELGVAQQLERLGAPLVPLDPRVPPVAHRRDGFVVTFWTHCASAGVAEPGPKALAAALALLHAALREVDVAVPHVADRVRQAQQLVADPSRTPRLAPADRSLLLEVLAAGADRVASTGRQQLLHGEPHPGNVLVTAQGPAFIDWETCCRGPVEFDLAHAPQGVGEVYPGVDTELLGQCRLLARAVATTWRYDLDDRLPGGVALGEAWLADLRSARRAR